MAEGLARHAYQRLAIYVHSAGLLPGGADPRAVAALTEIGIGLDPAIATSVRDIELGQFDLLVSLGIPKLEHQAHQMTLRWDEPAFRALDGSASLVRVRLARDALLRRITTLGAILSTTNRA